MLESAKERQRHRGDDEYQYERQPCVREPPPDQLGFEQLDFYFFSLRLEGVLRHRSNGARSTPCHSQNVRLWTQLANAIPTRLSARDGRILCRAMSSTVISGFRLSPRATPRTEALPGLESNGVPVFLGQRPTCAVPSGTAYEQDISGESRSQDSAAKALVPIADQESELPICPGRGAKIR